MRIGLVIYGVLQTVTGGYIYDRNLVAYLMAAGDDVHVISLPWRRYRDHLFYNFSRAIIKKISALQLDILLEDELNHPSCVVLNHQLKHRGRPYLVSIVHHLRMDEDQTAGNMLQAWVEKQYLKSVDGFIFNSKTTASSVDRFVAPKPSVIAYPGKNRLVPCITDRDVARRSREKGPLRIIFLGNVTPRKGLSMLIHALSSLPLDDWRLTVIGSLDRDRKHGKAILEQVRKNRLDNSILFAGQVSDADVAEHLRRNHILAVPSRYEGFGMVYAEAMGFGLPAIGTTSGGAGEIITQNVNGYLMDPDDIRALQDHIVHLNKDRRLLERMSKNCLNNYKTLPAWEQTGSKIRDFLCAITDRRPCTYIS